ncbi:MAG: Gfo/Idh/MocA family oxidoreductase [Micropruina sp.]|uniref:Gfo/Idh/MocA family protein n=1 Tax=Micropruina sp. TaxID=2737536 RepID=UPI0039E2AB86
MASELRGMRPTQTESPDRHPLRAAVVGTGDISRQHLAFLSNSPLAQLVGVCDLSPVARRWTADEYGTTPFASLEEMLEQSRPDVVHVLTPPTTHSRLARTALAAGAHVICEKPIALDADELVALLDEADRQGRVVVENHNYRFNPEIQQIDELIADGALGDIGEVEIRIGLPVTDPAGRFGDPNLPSPIHDLPAGVIHDFITHMAYLVGHFAPNVTWHRVVSAWSKHSPLAHIPVDDLDAVLVGEGDNGPVHARIRFSALLAPDCFEITVRGSRGYAQAELFSGRTTTIAGQPGGKQLGPIVNMMKDGVHQFIGGPRSLKRKILQQGPYAGLSNYLDLTYRALASGSPTPVTADDMLAASRLIDRLVAGRSLQEETA